MTREVDAPLGAARLRAIYDRLGARYDLLLSAARAPKTGALALLAVQPGERALEVGVGTGRVLVALAKAAAGCQVAQESGQDGDPVLVRGLDLSPVMVGLARERVRAAGLNAVVEVREGDARALPYPDASFDAAFSSYVLDLLSAADIAHALGELRRVLRPGGRLALVALSPGTSAPAQLFTTAYTALYRAHPDWLAGCRPIRLEPLLRDAGFAIRARRAWFRWHPSEAVLAAKPAG
ncbi:MAG TPA: methyltransferase domain-containing protein [Ktedonobacterales bacterium]|jgi:ubiquinone/menaquinone biosynthesis C-methylase UbiE